MHKPNTRTSRPGRGDHATLWSAVTCHRFNGLADLSARQSRVQRIVGKLGRPFAIDGDKSPAKSAARSAHSKALRIGRATVWTLLIALLAFVPTGVSAAEGSSDAIRVLFLGDRAGHRPADRFAIIQPVLAPRQIEVTYTETMTNLNPAYLARFDALLIYANVTRIAPEQEQAMLDFVSAGGGLVPIHCASYCFHNSTNYIALVGAQFRRHGAGVFQETIVNSDHPVMKGLSPIESWDETYVHTKHNTNRIVLAERRDDSGAEPWTWVRELGKGRVFYTAWGHDQRTWTNPGFQVLIERGIRWASANSPHQLKRKN